MTAIPMTPQEITAGWLSEVLDAPVEAVEVVDAHAGTTGRAVLSLSHNAPQLPRRLFVKLPPDDEMQRHFVVSTGMGRNEVRFYRELGPELPLRVPHCYYADASEDGSAYIMLLEHLEDSGCTFRNAKQRYGRPYLEEVLAAFARMHGAYWNSPRFDTDLAWLAPPVQHDIAVPLIERALRLHGARMPQVFTDIAQLYLSDTDALHRVWQRGTPTVIHGDVHDGNFFYDRDQPGLLDWAIVSHGPAMRDIGYFLAGMLEPAHQVQWGRELVSYYQAQLAQHCAQPDSVEELWEQYRWHAAYVWVGATVTLAMGDEWQPVKYVLAGLERVNTALETLDSVSALRAAIG